MVPARALSIATSVTLGLTLARRIGSDDRGQPYGYRADGRLLPTAMTANLGAAVNWTAAPAWSDTPVILGLTVRDSELASTVYLPGGQGAVIVAVTLVGNDVQLAGIDGAGALILGERQLGATRTVLLRLADARVSGVSLGRRRDSNFMKSVTVKIYRYVYGIFPVRLSQNHWSRCVKYTRCFTFLGVMQ